MNVNSDETVERLVNEHADIARIAALSYGRILGDPAEAYSVALGSLMRSAQLYDESKGYSFRLFTLQRIRWTLRARWRSARCPKRGGGAFHESVEQRRENSEWDVPAPMAEGFQVESAMVENLRQCLEQMDPRERDVLESRFGFNGDAESLGEIGARYNVTRERIRQLEMRALAKLTWLMKRHDSDVSDDCINTFREYKMRKRDYDSTRPRCGKSRSREVAMHA